MLRQDKITHNDATHIDDIICIHPLQVDHSLVGSLMTPRSSIASCYKDDQSGAPLHYRSFRHWATTVLRLS